MLLNVQCDGKQDGRDGRGGRAAEEAVRGPPRGGGAEAAGAA